MKSVLITGASSGIGEAIAVECARRGVEKMFLCGRDAARLEAVAEKCRGLGADAKTKIVDVADESAMREWIRECDAEAPLEVVFSNAGIGTGREDEANVRRTFAVNLGGCLNTVLPTIECFRKRGRIVDASLPVVQQDATSGKRGRIVDASLPVVQQDATSGKRGRIVDASLPVVQRDATSGKRGEGRRQIVITASIAGYAPLATCPSYAGTKAAAKNWGLSLRGMLKREGIKVNVVCPGFVRSRITDRNTCPMPFFMEADKAARVILNRVDRNVGLIAFPWPMRLATWFLSAIPWRLAEFVSGILPEKNAEGRNVPF